MQACTHSLVCCPSPSCFFSFLVQTSFLDPLPQYQNRSEQSSRSSIRQELEKLKYAPVIAGVEEVAILKSAHIIKHNAPGTSLYTVRQVANFLQYHNLDSEAASLRQEWQQWKEEHGYDASEENRVPFTARIGPGRILGGAGGAGGRKQQAAAQLNRTPTSSSGGSNPSSNASSNHASPDATDDEDDAPLVRQSKMPKLRHTRGGRAKTKAPRHQTNAETDEQASSTSVSGRDSHRSALAARRKKQPKALDVPTPTVVLATLVQSGEEHPSMPVAATSVLNSHSQWRSAPAAAAHASESEEEEEQTGGDVFQAQDETAAAELEAVPYTGGASYSQRLYQGGMHVRSASKILRAESSLTGHRRRRSNAVGAAAHLGYDLPQHIGGRGSLESSPGSLSRGLFTFQPASHSSLSTSSFQALGIDSARQSPLPVYGAPAASYTQSSHRRSPSLQPSGKVYEEAVALGEELSNHMPAVMMHMPAGGWVRPPTTAAPVSITSMLSPSSLALNAALHHHVAQPTSSAASTGAPASSGPFVPQSNSPPSPQLAALFAGGLAMMPYEGVLSPRSPPGELSNLSSPPPPSSSFYESKSSYHSRQNSLLRFQPSLLSSAQHSRHASSSMWFPSHSRQSSMLLQSSHPSHSRGASVTMMQQPSMYAGTGGGAGAGLHSRNVSMSIGSPLPSGMTAHMLNRSHSLAQEQRPMQQQYSQSAEPPRLQRSSAAPSVTASPQQAQRALFLAAPSAASSSSSLAPSDSIAPSAAATAARPLPARRRSVSESGLAALLTAAAHNKSWE